jgi:hypothetical protein
MAVHVVSRAEWGAVPWDEDGIPASVPARDRRYFVVHYDGGVRVLRTGPQIPRAIDAAHRRKGWLGIGYHFVVSQAGEVFEGRGWGFAGAHCPGRNRDGIGVQVAIGGDQQPTPAALAAVRALYAEACDRADRQLDRTWHGAHIQTDCPGAYLIAWVRAGMPDPSSTTTRTEDDMTPEQMTELVERTARRAADLITGAGARYPVLVDEGTGSAELPDGRDIDPIPTVLGELQGDVRTLLEQQRQVLQLLAGPKA